MDGTPARAATSTMRKVQRRECLPALLGQRGSALRGSPDRLAARSAAVALLRPSHQPQPAVTTMAPTRDPTIPLGFRSRPSPDSRLVNNPPMNEPTSPATIAIVQSILPC